MKQCPHRKRDRYLSNCQDGWGYDNTYTCICSSVGEQFRKECTDVIHKNCYLPAKLRALAEERLLKQGQQRLSDYDISKEKVR